jgi:hypothetical protein
VKQLTALSAEDLTQRQQEVLSLHKALSYLQRYDLITSDYQPQQALGEIAVSQAWLKPQ